MTNSPPRCGEGSDHNERAKHPLGLFRVAMRLEETARVVNEHFIKLGRNDGVNATQPVLDRREDLSKGIFPGLAADADFGRRQLPHLADGGVNNGFRPATIRRAIRLPDELLNLRRGHRKRKQPRALHLDARHRRFQRAADKKIARPPHAGQQLLQRLQIVVVWNVHTGIGHAGYVTPPHRKGQGREE